MGVNVGLRAGHLGDAVGPLRAAVANELDHGGNPHREPEGEQEALPRLLLERDAAEVAEQSRSDRSIAGEEPFETVGDVLQGLHRLVPARVADRAEYSLT